MALFTPRSQNTSLCVEIVNGKTQYHVNNQQFIIDRLYWVSSSEIPNKSAEILYIFTDQAHEYQAFNMDFGPLDIGHVYKFTLKIDSSLKIARQTNKKICIYTGSDLKKCANSIFLTCCYQILILNKTAEQSWQPFERQQFDLPAYRDSTNDPICEYKCTILHCLKGLEFALKQKWFDLKTFNLTEYDKLSLKGFGDINEIIPCKLFAFSSPLEKRPYDAYGKIYTPIDYIPLFKKLNIKLVIRLCLPLYDKNIFLQNGIDHCDLMFEDGSAPNENILQQFLAAVENCKGAVAVHCKSGLGRTGTLIGMYAMKHYKMKADEFIGWVRVVRPGSIHGPQHQYLIDNQNRMLNYGQYNQYNNKYNNQSMINEDQQFQKQSEERQFQTPQKQQQQKDVFNHKITQIKFMYNNLFQQNKSFF